MAVDKKLAAARKVYNSQKSTNKHAFENAVFEYESQLEQEGFEVRGIDFKRKDESAVIWGRYDDVDYDRRENDAIKLYLTVNRYGTRYIAIDYHVHSRRG